MPGPKEPTDLLRTAEHPAVAAEPAQDFDSAPPPTTRFPSVALRTAGAPGPDAESSQGHSTERTHSAPTAINPDRATLIVLSGLTAGQVFKLDKVDHVLGRGVEADLWFDDPAISRAHARITHKADGRFVFEDLGSSNGSFVRGRKVEGRGVELQEDDRVQLGPHLMLRFAVTNEAEASLQRRLYEHSTRDALTRAYNRKYLVERLAAEIGHCRRHKNELTLLMLDLDRFKDVNDTYGHPAGDEVLRAVSTLVQRMIRIEDVFARYGGEEFVIVVRATPTESAAKLAERVRAAVEELRIAAPGADAPLSVTTSIGFATLSRLPPETGVTELIAAADGRLYRAKADGRNRVCGDDAEGPR